MLASDLPMPGEPRYCPSWSPDGHHIAFVQFDSPQSFHPYLAMVAGNALVVNISTGQVTRLSSFAGQDTTFPTWSPDGGYVAFVSTRIPSSEQSPFHEQIPPGEVWVASIDGSQLHSLSTTARWGDALAWSLPVSTGDMR